MKIIVTGGAGFIGSHVAAAYRAAGHHVAIIDNLSSGKRVNLPRGVTFYKADIRNAAAMNRICKRERPDVLNHHAAFISVTASVKKPKETFDINVSGTLNIILAFAQSGPQKKKMLFSSTGGAIYGDPKKLPADESTPPHPLSPYALSKYVDEQMIAYYCGAYGMSYLIFRYANAYGPRQREQGGAGIFPIFSHLIREGKIPTIFGDGTKTRDYVYVEDVARASVLALTRGKDTIVNISSGRETSDYAVFKAIAKTFDFTKEPHYTPKRKGEVVHIFMSYKKAKRILGWQPKFTLAQGILKTVRSFG